MNESITRDRTAYSEGLLPTRTRRRLIVGISGATGVVYAIRLLQLLREADVETHLVVSKPGEMTRAYETEMSMKDLRGLADVSYSIADVGAAISSGSFKTMGMVVAPCSIRTLSEIATGVTSTLLTRAADVVLKERRRLVLMVRETPLHAGHLKSMLAATENGAIIAPPVPAFYTGAQTIDDLVDHTVGRVLDLFDIDTDAVKRWGEGDGLRALGKAVRVANGFDNAAQM
ncbi:aromatic acid decarboxylase [Hymenobacter amundsenii]|uniref:Flavin prenyltransferase UbiX n=1 Tax=Hymenobacter amundsenii TaxID=2006685 RepID=A0A246FG39_9BACT|nr:UbiX family flavin prenyltransferase [Hymenobacter amundsenii]OWP61500.1 aromatic acid decarboxylase [Hymenobacter amundsenii]